MRSEFPDRQIASRGHVGVAACHKKVEDLEDLWLKEEKLVFGLVRRKTSTEA